MKRYFCLLFAVCLLLVIPVSVRADGVLYGDVNGDGSINAKDATMILRHSVGKLSDLSKFDMVAADVNADGIINAKDATMILRYSVKKLDKFPAESHEHSYEAVVTQPTCTEDGYTTYTCACGDSYTEDIPARGHNWGEWQVTKEPTAEAEGEEIRGCAECNEFETRPVKKLPEESEVPHVHSYEAVVTVPTCTEKGYTTYTCACGDSYTDDETDVLYHEWANSDNTNYCARCGICFDEIPSCDNCVFTQSTTNPPTCEEIGHTFYYCAICGDKKLVKHEALGHKWNDSNTCVNCGKTETPTEPPHEHDYTSEVKAPTCTKAGYTRYTCSCGYIYRDDYTEALGHEWNDWVEAEVPTTSAEGELSRTCSVCGKTEHYYDSKHYLYSEMIYDENGKAVGWDITCRWRHSNDVMCDYHKVIEMEGNEEFCGFNYNGRHYESWTTVYDENGEAIGKEAKCMNGSIDGGKCDYYDFVAFNKMPENFDPSICGEHTRKDYWYNFDWECMSELSLGTCRDCGYVFILDGSDASVSVEALEYLNERRAEYGLPALEGVNENEKIITHMKLRAEELAYVVPLTAQHGHDRPDGTQGAGPCVAGGYGPQSVIDAWLESDGHRGWLLSEDATVAIITNAGSCWIYWTDGGLPN